MKIPLAFGKARMQEPNRRLKRRLFESPAVGNVLRKVAARVWEPGERRDAQRASRKTRRGSFAPACRVQARLPLPRHCERPRFSANPCGWPQPGGHDLQNIYVRISLLSVYRCNIK